MRKLWGILALIFFITSLTSCERPTNGINFISKTTEKFDSCHALSNEWSGPTDLNVESLRSLEINSHQLLAYLFITSEQNFLTCLNTEDYNVKETCDQVRQADLSEKLVTIRVSDIPAIEGFCDLIHINLDHSQNAFNSLNSDQLAYLDSAFGPNPFPINGSEFIQEIVKELGTVKLE